MSWDTQFIGKAFTIDEFSSYVKRSKFGWSPKGVTIHHTSAPSLAQRPSDFTSQHMLNIKDFYENTKGWTTGPHLFIDRKYIWVFVSITQQGIHSKSFNRTHFGVEMLGDYDYETPNKDVIYLTYVATSLLLKKIGRSTASVNFHRDDPKTTKSCPGVKVRKSWFIPGLVSVYNNAHLEDVRVNLVKSKVVLPIFAYIKKGQSITTAPLSELETHLLFKRSSIEDHEVGVASFLRVNNIPFNWDSKTKTISL